jgi:hypothetical protein
MTRGPEFDDLIGAEVPDGERDRLRRVHDLIVAAGPPADLSPELAQPVRPRQTLPVMQRRRWGALALAATLVLAAFFGGYVVGNREGGPSVVGSGFETVRTYRLRGTASAAEAVALIRVGTRDRGGNLPMLVTVEGLRTLPPDGYYRLGLTKAGRIVVTCGTFNSRGLSQATTVRLAAAYEIESFDGFAVAEYLHGRKREPVVLTQVARSA